MTDRELLESAAKACGWRVIWYGNNPEITPITSHGGATGTRWNPLTDDGDALRLAVNLGILVNTGTTSRFAVAVSVEQILEERLPDPYTATRRAIVRAAAEIGKAMK